MNTATADRKLIEIHEFKPRKWHTARSLCGNAAKPWQAIHNRTIVAEFATEAEAIESANRIFFEVAR